MLSESLPLTVDVGVRQVGGEFSGCQRVASRHRHCQHSEDRHVDLDEGVSALVCRECERRSNPKAGMNVKTAQGAAILPPPPLPTDRKKINYNWVQWTSPTNRSQPTKELVGGQAQSVDWGGGKNCPNV